MKLKTLFASILATVCLGLSSCGKNGDSPAKADVTVGLICLHGAYSTYDNNFIVAMKETQKKMGFKLVLMSGSGSSVFALTTNHKLAFLKFHELEKKGYEVYLTKTL